MLGYGLKRFFIRSNKSTARRVEGGRKRAAWKKDEPFCGRSVSFVVQHECFSGFILHAAGQRQSTQQAQCHYQRKDKSAAQEDGRIGAATAKSEPVSSKQCQAWH